MTTLRDCMIEDLQLRIVSANTQEPCPMLLTFNMGPPVEVVVLEACGPLLWNLSNMGRPVAVSVQLAAQSDRIYVLATYISPDAETNLQQPQVKAVLDPVAK